MEISTAVRRDRMLPSLLLVNEEPQHMVILENILRQEMPGCRVFSCLSPMKAIEIASKEAIDCAIIAVHMTTMSGIDLCRDLKSSPHSDNFPILLVTEQDTDVETRIASLEAGADDILYRVSEPFELLAKIRVMLRIKRAENELREVNRRLAEMAEGRSRELYETDRRYRFLQEASSDAVFTFQVNSDGDPGPMLEINDVACQWLGYSRDEFLRRNLKDFATPERIKSLPARIESILQHRQLFFETVWVARDGRRVPMYVTAAVFETEQGRVIINVARKSDGDNHAENSDTHYRFLADQTGLLIYDYTIKTGHVDWSGAITQVTGYASNEMEQFSWRRWQRQIHPDDRTRILSRIRDTLDQVGKYQMEYRIRQKSGEYRYVEDLGVALPGTDGHALRVIGTMKDITSRIRAEEERRRLENELQHSQRLESLGVLAGGIAHDFNNILAGIIGLTDLALRDIPEESRTHTDLREALQAAHRAKDLVKQILAFSRQSGQERAPLYMHVIAREVLKLLRASLPSNIELIDSVDVHSGAVVANAAQMHQVIMNFCTNAAQAMTKKGGYLEIRVKDVEVDVPLAAANPRLRIGSYVCLSVHDSGHGMAPAVLKRVFDPFFTTKGPGEGTGMGLAVVHGIISDHGGAVMAESRCGVGSVFYAYLPKIAGIVVEEIPMAPITTGGNERILFVDDDEAVLRFAELALPRLGFTVSLYKEAQPALAAFQRAPRQFDLVITDLIMPGITGDLLSRSLRSIRPDIPIILFTGYSNQFQVDQFTAAGVASVLIKPISVNDLIMEIRRVMDEHRSTIDHESETKQDH